jgi:enolase
MPKIAAVHAREILDSRGNPTIETTVWSDAGYAAVSSIPSGASTGKYEALELRDGDMSRFKGQGVLKAVENVNVTIATKIIGMDPTYQTKIDKALVDLDGTENKSKLGANAILSVSQAVCELGAIVTGRPTFRYLSEKYGLAALTAANMPTPIFNLINGGKHGAGNNLDFQEFHIIPSSSQSFTQALAAGDVIYQTLKGALVKRNAVYSVGDEGGFAPNLYTNTDALELLVESINASNYILGKDVFMGLDTAANSFYRDGKYSIKDKGQALGAEDMMEFYLQLNKDYQLLELEDPLNEDDFDNWAKLTSQLGKATMVVGDDLLVTNKKRLLKAIEKKACNAVLIKPNQIGTVSETVEVVKIAKEQGMSIVVSHRSGETVDDFIADFAVGVGADYVKFGAPARGERVVKYNRLMAIESALSR